MANNWKMAGSHVESYDTGLNDLTGHIIRTFKKVMDNCDLAERAVEIAREAIGDLSIETTNHEHHTEVARLSMLSAVYEAMASVCITEAADNKLSLVRWLEIVVEESKPPVRHLELD